MYRLFVGLGILMILLAGCGAAPEPTATPTPTITPTAIPTATNTRPPTFTPIPTNTPTDTPTVTHTPTSTSTPTATDDPTIVSYFATENAKVTQLAQFATDQALITTFTDYQCTNIAIAAAQNAENSCAGSANNSVCYGNDGIVVTSNGVTDFDFNQRGDVLDIRQVERLRLLNTDYFANEWGISVVKAKATLPEEIIGYVPIWLFGDVDITPLTNVSVTVTTRRRANVRLGSTANSALIGVIPRGEVIESYGVYLNEDGEYWLRVEYTPPTPTPRFIPDGANVEPLVVDASPISGWISNFTVLEDVRRIPQLQPNGERFGSLYAFKFASGVDDRPCAYAPESGMIIQTPEEAETVNFLINEVDIRIGSTVFIQATPGGFMRIYVLDGDVEVRAGGVEQVVPVGSYVLIPLDENGIASGKVVFPQQYSYNDLLTLQTILNNLPDPITLPRAATTEMLAAVASPTPDYRRFASAANVPALSAQPVVFGVNCGSFRPTSPMNGIAWVTNTFYWDPAPFPDEYVISLILQNGELVEQWRASGEKTNLEVSTRGTTWNFLPHYWEIQVITNGQISCTGRSPLMYREFPDHNDDDDDDNGTEEPTEEATEES